MFERYTELARLVIFRARHEAQRIGSDYIEPEHLLIGLLREDPDLLPRFLPEGIDASALLLAAENALPPREMKDTSPDKPMSHPTKRILAYGAQEAEKMHHRHIGTEHHLLGLLREPTQVSRLLEELGFIWKRLDRWFSSIPTCLLGLCQAPVPGARGPGIPRKRRDSQRPATKMERW